MMRVGVVMGIEWSLTGWPMNSFLLKNKNSIRRHSLSYQKYNSGIQSVCPFDRHAITRLMLSDIQ
jgi:hypothetical protein